MPTFTGMLAAVGDIERSIVVDLLLILAVAGVVAIIMQRMRMALVPAYLIAGAVIGPNALAFAPSQETLAEVSHLAIILLLFGIGLELDITVLRRGLARMILAGVGSTVLTVLLGWPVALFFGLSGPAALAVGMAFSLSSTAVVLRIITARRELRRRRGRLAFSILVIQDVLVLAMLAVLPLVAGWGGVAVEGLIDDGPTAITGKWLDFAGEAMIRIGGVAALVVVAKVVLPRILRESLRGRRLEVMMLVAIAAALAAAVVAHSMNFSHEMGAFIAGFVLAGTPFRHQLSGQIGPLRDIFSALFFTTVGMKVDPAVIMESWWIIALCVVLLVVVKGAVIAGVCWSVGAMASTALVVGLSLAQAGEFSLILLGESGDLGLLSENVVASCIAIVVISLVITPALADLGRRLAHRASRLGHAPWISSSLLAGASENGDPSERPVRHIIVAGFGPIGQRITEELDRIGVSYTLVELNPDTVREQQRRGKSIIFGDIGNLQVLETAGIDHADALILTVPDEEAVMRACAVARRRAPNIFIAARTGLLSKSTTATKLGADHVTVDEMATAEAMLQVVVERLRGDEEIVPPQAMDEPPVEAEAEPGEESAGDEVSDDPSSIPPKVK